MEFEDIQIFYKIWLPKLCFQNHELNIILKRWNL